MVGYISADNTMEINHNKDAQRVWGPGDRLIVLADD